MGEMRGIVAEQGLWKFILSRARAGDREAFHGILKAFVDPVKAFIRSRIKAGYAQRLDPDEILQDTLVRAFQSIQSFQGDDPEQFRRWLIGVANKTVLRAKENARQCKTLEIQEKVAAKDASPSKGMRREERFDRFQTALNSLSADHREVILLTRIEGLSLKQAAERMGRSSEAVRKLFWRALKQLRSALTHTESLRLPHRQLKSKDEGDETRR